MSERMMSFMVQCMEAMASGDINLLHEIVTEYHAQDELRFIRAEDPEFYNEVISKLNNTN